MKAHTVFPASALIRAISLLVPAWRRPDWIAEWRGEVEHAWAESRAQGQPSAWTRVRLSLRAIDSVPDALWLRRRDRAGDGWMWSSLDAFRSLRRRPGFSLAVIGTLALGMGSATAIYTIMDGLMLRPIPFREPERLVSVLGRSGTPNLDEVDVWKSQSDVFEDARAHGGRSVVLTGAGEARSYRAELVEPGYLEMLGVQPLIGRSFTPEEVQPGADAVLLLSHEVWRDAFAGDPRVLGRTVEVDGRPHTIIGVLPPTVRLSFGGVISLMLPLNSSNGGRVSLLGRLHPGVAVEAASDRLRTVAERLAVEQPRAQGLEVSLRPIGRDLSPGRTKGLWTLGAAVTCLLLIACANAAGLFFLRGVSREPELALRVALGGTRASLIRHVFAESLLLALAAGALGTGIAWVGVRLLKTVIPSGLLRFSYTAVGIDARVLAFAFALTLATGLLFGVVPAWRAASTTAARAGRSSTASRRDVSVRSLVQVGQLALAVLLLSGAGLFGRSFLKLISVPVGYAVDEILVLELVSLERLRDADATYTFAHELNERLAALPGVEGVTRQTGVGFRFDYTIELDDGRKLPSDRDYLPSLSVDTAYFRVMGIPIVEGRDFQAEDVIGERTNVVIEHDLAAKLWPGQSAVGRRFRVEEDPWLTVVGVTGEVKLEGPLDPLGQLLYFTPASDRQLRSGAVIIRASGDPEALMPSVRALVRDVDSAQPISTLQTGRQAIGETIQDPRFLLVIMTVFAVVAVTLAAIGVYGLVSFTVAQRTREIGVRMALGARAQRVVGSVFGEGILLGLVGTTIGLAAAALLSRFVSALLFNVSPLDPVAMAVAGAALLAACAAALLLPALRAAAVQPVEALRAE
jgi:predicted permease